MQRTILMLEHDEDDRYITRSTFGEKHFDVAVDFVGNKPEFFQRLESGAAPSLILLNYHAGPGTAIEILKELKSREAFAHIPIVVLSGSATPQIVKECYEAGASSFIRKPSRASETDAKIANFFRYWFETVELSR